MKRFSMPLILTLSGTKGDNTICVMKLWLFAPGREAKAGTWYIEDTDFVNLFGWERSGQFKVVDRATVHRVDFWDRDENQPAFCLWGVPICPCDKAPRTTSMGMILNPRNPPGLENHSLEWSYRPARLESRFPPAKAGTPAPRRHHVKRDDQKSKKLCPVSSDLSMKEVENEEGTKGPHRRTAAFPQKPPLILGTEE